MRHLQNNPVITNRKIKSTGLSLSVIGKVGLISADEEASLAKRIGAGDPVALVMLNKRNLRFVVSVPKKCPYQGLLISDLICEGNVSLIKAAKRFDEIKASKFIFFAVSWRRQSMMEDILLNERTIRPPMNIMGAITPINKAFAIVEQFTQRPPSVELAAGYLGITAKKLRGTGH